MSALVKASPRRLGIAGAGLAGRLLAWRLLRLGHRVSLFDQDAGDGERAAGLIAAAMLAPASEAVAAGPEIYTPGLASLRQWPRWLAELELDSGRRVAFQQRGSVVVAHSADSAELEWFYTRLASMPDVPEQHRQRIGSARILKLEPELAAFDTAVFLPQEGCLDNRALFGALGEAITQRGGEWHTGQTITRAGPGYLATSSERYSFDLVFDCRGFGAKTELGDLRGVRGELLWVRAPQVTLSRPVRLMHPRYQLYIAPKPDHTYVIGATEIESESLAPVSVRATLELLSALYTVHPGFAEAELLEARSHCRPAFSDNLPKISREPGVIRVNGLYRHGYLLGPAVVSSVLALLEGGRVQVPVRLDETGSVPVKHHAEE